MIFGRKFTLLTDHKPLLSIFRNKKSISAHATSRLQRWALILTAYDFHVKFVKTEDFGNVDVLSRLIAEYSRDDDELVIAHVDMDTDLETMLTAQTDVIPATSMEIAEATKNNETLQAVDKFMDIGWPRLLLVFWALILLIVIIYPKFLTVCL